MTRKRIVVICPGRGSYGRDELGYLARYGAHARSDIEELDRWRASRSEPTVTDLDGASRYSPGLHTPGENASVLIYACALADYLAIDTTRYEVVAITGNSMGWYLALAMARCLDRRGAFEVINTMGSMMKGGVIGGQVIYPVVDEQWRPSPPRLSHVRKVMSAINGSGKGRVYDSIKLGGYIVLGGDEAGVKRLVSDLEPVEDRYPFRLINHAAFHTPLLEGIAKAGQEALPSTLFAPPKISLIDGRGVIWQPYSSEIDQLYAYTLGHQVVSLYDYTAALKVALKEFAPDHLVLLGPGSSLGGVTAQVCIEAGWLGMKSKSDFQVKQEAEPFILAMGREQQRQILVK